MAFSPKHILVPVAIDKEDELVLAEHAVLAACDIAEKFGSKITLLYLTPVMITGANAPMDVSGQIYQSLVDIVKTRAKRNKQKLEELSEVAHERGLEVHGRVVDSFERVPQVILHTADELSVDLIVMGSHGRHGLSKMFFGSVAQKVSEDSPVPVLLLHPKKGA